MNTTAPVINIFLYEKGSLIKDLLSIKSRTRTSRSNSICTMTNQSSLICNNNKLLYKTRIMSTDSMSENRIVLLLLNGSVEESCIILHTKILPRNADKIIGVYDFGKSQKS